MRRRMENIFMSDVMITALWIGGIIFILTLGQFSISDKVFSKFTKKKKLKLIIFCSLMVSCISVVLTLGISAIVIQSFEIYGIIGRELLK